MTCTFYNTYVAILLYLKLIGFPILIHVCAPILSYKSHHYRVKSVTHIDKSCCTLQAATVSYVLQGPTVTTALATTYDTLCTGVIG